MKTIIKSLLLAAVITVAWGCSSSDDETSNTGNAATFQPANAPEWVVDMYSNQEQPQWLSPDALAG